MPIPNDTNAQLAGEECVFLALAEDTALQALLGGSGRVFLAWPDETLKKGDFPRVTFLSWGVPVAGGRRAKVTVQLGAWGWKGQEATAAQMDVRFEALFKNREFVHRGFRVHTEIGSCAPPVGGGDRIARMREVVAMVAPA